MRKNISYITAVVLMITVTMLYLVPNETTAALGTPTSLTSGSSTTNTTSYNTASITPTANATVFLWVQAYDVAFLNPPSFTVSGNGLTWVEVATLVGVDGFQRLSLYRATGPSPSTGAITIGTSLTVDAISWTVVQVTGTSLINDGNAAIVQVATNQSASATTLTTTLAARQSTNNIFMSFGEGEEPNTTLGTDYTEIVEQNVNDGYNITINANYDTTGDTSATVTQTSASFSNIIAIEVAPQRDFLGSEIEIRGQVIIR